MISGERSTVAWRKWLTADVLDDKCGYLASQSALGLFKALEVLDVVGDDAAITGHLIDDAIISI
jgi:hypothetical protein